MVVEVSALATRSGASRGYFDLIRAATPATSAQAGLVPLTSQYWWVSGTSPACALVAGVAALIKSKYPGLAPDLVASALTSTTTDRPASGYDSQVGFGIVNAAAALAKAGKLAGARPAKAGLKATAEYRGEPPLVPVHPRGSGQLALFALLALTSLALTAIAGARLAVLLRAKR